MPASFTAGVRDSLSNLAASLGAGKDKAAYDSFVLFDLDRGQIEAMYRGDWLARKVVDIVPYDTVREWREWSGHRDDVARVEAAERRLGLRKALQRALTLGRLYGGGPAGIPDDWVERSTRRKGGLQWSDPKNGNNVVRSMPADPDSPYLHQRVPYIVDQNRGFMDVNGQPIGGADPKLKPEAHTPASDFIFKQP